MTVEKRLAGKPVLLTQADDFMGRVSFDVFEEHDGRAQ